MQAQEAKDTTRQWDLIAAANEDAIIAYLNLRGREATKIRGRSRIAFKNKKRNCLEGIEANETIAPMATRVNWLRHVAGQHTKMGNKLINVARRMITVARNKEDIDRA